MRGVGGVRPVDAVRSVDDAPIIVARAVDGGQSKVGTADTAHVSEGAR